MAKQLMGSEKLGVQYLYRIALSDKFGMD